MFARGEGFMVAACACTHHHQSRTWTNATLGTGTRWTRICRARLAYSCRYTSTGTITAATALTTCTYQPPCLASVGNGSGRPENTSSSVDLACTCTGQETGLVCSIACFLGVILRAESAMQGGEHSSLCRVSVYFFLFYLTFASLALHGQ